MDTLICLDIDGTITEDKFSVPIEIVNYLRGLVNKGYSLFLVTGRPFSFTIKALSGFDFPYYLSCQNGSVILLMPEKKELDRKYLSSSVLPPVENAYQEFPLDFLIYSGYETGDFCYYRRKNFSKEYLEYLDDLQKREEAPWQDVHSFDKGGLFSFPLIKGFGPKKIMELIKDKLEEQDLFQLSLIKDPFNAVYRLLLITERSVNKGSAVHFLKKNLKSKYVIAAGDDENDASMIAIADTKIVMNTAPTHLKRVADIIALPPRELGIIHALEEVLA